MKRLMLLAAAVVVLSTAPAAGATLTYVDLVDRLTSMEALAVLPQPGERCEQASSYDRASRYDEATGKYVHWDANGDNNGHVRMEGDQMVMAEIEGPGCIWRIWSALAEQGHVKIYLDGASEPAVDLPFDGYFNGQNAPFDYPGLVHTVARGRNCYVPIPFQKSCKVVADKGWGAYYQFTYTVFPKGTTVPTFSRNLSLKERIALARASDIVTNRLGQDPAVRKGQSRAQGRLQVRPEGTQVIAELSGPRAITGLQLRLNGLTEGGSADLLRSAVLRIRWDGESSPSVWAPLGDFFGSAPGLRFYKSLPLGVTADGFYSFWYMPFARSAVVEIINEGRETLQGTFAVTHAPLSQPADKLGRFHAKWFRDSFLPKDEERRKIDWTLLKTEGRGRFAGVMLEVWNPRGGWWGEGDEKFWVDGEKFPSTIGTGSEDYFGYAWCCPELFQNAFHNQPWNDGDNKGHVCVNRWQISDSIPFQTSFEGAIEKYYDNNRPTLYAATSYWYLEPGGKDPYRPVPLTERLGWYVPVAPSVVKGAIEAEKMKVLKVTGGELHRQEMALHGTPWSQDTQLWWTQAKPGDILQLELPVGSDGSYELKAQFTKAQDYGIVQMSLDGSSLGKPIDLYNAGVTATGEVSLGVHQLSRGNHTLTAEIVGANEKAIKSHMFGLDYVRLVKQ